MEQAAVFMSNRSQPVRLPKSVALPSDVTRVNIMVIGRTRLLIPVGETWGSWFDEPGLSDDFDRDQPMSQEREGTS
jgi:antitoxin VapB